MSSITARFVKPIAQGARFVIRDAIFFVALPAVYRFGTLRPVDEKRTLFVEETNTEPSDNITLVMRELEGRGFDCQLVSLGHYRLSTFSYYVQCAKMLREAATARFVFLSLASVPLSCVPLRKETSAVQLWHACGAFKKFGMSTADKLYGDSRAEKKRHPYFENLSLVTVSSPEVRWAYIEAMDLGDTPEVVQATGVSRTDVYFDETYLAAQRQQIFEIVPGALGKKALLYAPTFRGPVADAEGPDALDIPLLKERLCDEYVLLIKHHPHVKNRPPIPQDCRDFAFDVSDTLNIEAVLAAADVCVSDYSSLIFEYSLLGRPMAFFAFDRADYDDWRGFYYDYDEMTPGPVFTTTEELVDWIEHLDERFDRGEVEAFRKKFMGACDGHATTRIVDAILGE